MIVLEYQSGTGCMGLGSHYHRGLKCLEFDDFVIRACMHLHLPNYKTWFLLCFCRNFAYVRVHGHLRSFQGKRNVVAFSVR